MSTILVMGWPPTMCTGEKTGDVIRLLLPIDLRLASGLYRTETYLTSSHHDYIHVMYEL